MGFVDPWPVVVFLRYRIGSRTRFLRLTRTCRGTVLRCAREFVGGDYDLTAYLAFFANRRCRESGLSKVASQGKALEIAVLGLVAFLEIPAKGSAFEARTLLDIVFDFRSLPGRYLQTVVLFVGLSKLGVWLYLYSLVLRYHAYGNRDVFARIPSLFPSMREKKKVHPPAPNAGAEAPANPGIVLIPKDIDDQAAGTKQG